MKFYCINFATEKSQVRESGKLELMNSVSMGFPNSELLQQNIVKDVPNGRVEKISLLRSSINIALGDKEPIVALLDKNLLKIRRFMNHNSMIHRMFRSRKKFSMLEVFVHLWKPLSESKLCKVDLLKFSEIYSNLSEMKKHPKSFINDNSSISLSPNGLFLVYSLSLSCLDKETKSKTSINQIILVDIQKHKAILQIELNSSINNDVINNNVRVYWSQDSQLLAVNNEILNHLPGESLIIGIDTEKYSALKSPLKFKEQVLSVIWLKLNKYQACFYKAAESALTFHIIKKTEDTLTVQVLTSINLGSTFESSGFDAQLSPVAITYDTFDKCYFFWAHQKLRNPESTCDHIVMSLPESTFNIPSSDSTGPHRPQWPSLGEPGRLSPQCYKLRSRVPASTPFALPNPVHRNINTMAVELDMNGEPHLRVLSGCRSVYSPPSLRRLAARAVYAVPGALEQWIMEGRVPKSVLLKQLGHNSYNLGPIDIYPYF